MGGSGRLGGFPDTDGRLRGGGSGGDAVFLVPKFQKKKDPGLDISGETGVAGVGISEH